MYLKKAKDLFAYTVDIRRKIHENPELAGKEDETVKLVCQELNKMGISYDVVNQGGVIGYIKGNKKVDNPKTILLRAELLAIHALSKAKIKELCTLVVMMDIAPYF